MVANKILFIGPSLLKFIPRGNKRTNIQERRMAQEIVRVSSYRCGEEALELRLQLGRKDMHSSHSSSLSFGIAFCVCEPKGGQRMRASGCQNTRRGNPTRHEPDLTLRIDYVGQNGTTWVKLSSAG